MGSVSETTEQSRESVPREVLAATAVTAAEGLALVGIAVFLVVETIAGDPRSVFGALSGAGIALVAAACLIGLTWPLRRLRRWARTPVVVLQVLWLPVGFSLAFQAGLPGYGVPILLAALAVLILFGTPAARAAFDNE